MSSHPCCYPSCRWPLPVTHLKSNWLLQIFFIFPHLDIGLDDSVSMQMPTQNPSSALYCSHLQRSLFFLFTQSYHTAWITVSLDCSTFNNCLPTGHNLLSLLSIQLYALMILALQGFYSTDSFSVSVWSLLSPLHEVILHYWVLKFLQPPLYYLYMYMFHTWLQIPHICNEGDEQIFEMGHPTNPS